MKRLFGPVLAAALAIGSTAAPADTIKVGVIAPLSGPFAQMGRAFEHGVATYQALYGTQAGDHEVEFIWKDSGGVNPDKSRSLAQELLIREKVDYLAGFGFTPNALAVATLMNQSDTPTVIFNAATSLITAESPLYLRTSFTLAQVSAPMAEWAFGQGIRTVAITVSDYGPGIDAEVAFKARFEELGGTVVKSIRMPLSTADFTPFLLSVREEAPDGVFVFVPGGPTTFAYTKAYTENGMREAGITFLGTGETEEANLQQLGDAVLGLHTAYHYSAAHPSELNARMIETANELFDAPLISFPTVGAFDGAHIIYRMVAAEGADGPAAVEAVKGMAWESPRGPLMMDPETRTIIQNVYIREVIRNAETGLLENVEQGVIATVGDLGWAR